MKVCFGQKTLFLCPQVPFKSFFGALPTREARAPDDHLLWVGLGKRATVPPLPLWALCSSLPIGYMKNLGLCPKGEVKVVHGYLWESVCYPGPTVASHLSQALQVSFQQLLWSVSVQLLFEFSFR